MTTSFCNDFRGIQWRHISFLLYPAPLAAPLRRVRCMAFTIGLEFLIVVLARKSLDFAAATVIV